MPGFWWSLSAALLLALSGVEGHAQGAAAASGRRAGSMRSAAGGCAPTQRLTKEAVQKGEFAFLWKMKIENASRQLNSLTPPVLLDRLIGYRGFKSLAFFGGSDDRVFSIDTDLARPYWTTVLNYTAATGGQPPSSVDCPGGLIAMPSRRTALAPAAPGGGGGGGRGGVRNGSAVGEPGRGAAVLSQAPPQPGGGRGPGGGAGPAAAQGRGGRGPAPIGFGGVDPLFAVGGDGYIHTLYVSNGAHMEPPVPFLPPDTKPSALIWVDGVVYTTTSGECGAAPNALWAMDLTVPAGERKTMSWKTGGANIAGQSGLAFGTDGTIYVALGSAQKARALRLDRRPRSRHADAEGLVHRARRRLQRDAHRRSPQGQGSDRGDGERWTLVPARRGIARRQRSQDAARRDGEVHGSRRRNGARDV